MEDLTRNIFNRETLLKYAVFSFPLFATTVQSWHTLLLFFIVVGSFCVVRQFNRTEVLLLLLLFAFLFFSTLSLLNTNDTYQSFKRLGKLSYLICWPILGIMLQRRIKGLDAVFFWGMVVGSIFMMLVAGWQVYVVGLDRAAGAYHPIVFGNMAALYACIGIAFLGAGPSTGRYRFLVLASIACALIASALSLSRGGWVALPFTMLFLLWMVRKKISLRPAVLGIVILAGVFLPLGDSLQLRWQQTVSDIQYFADGSDKNTSVGQRFLMWDIAWSSFREHPIIGSGLGDFGYEARRRVAGGETELDIIYSHAHNIYLEYLGMTGILGFAAMVLSLIVLPFHAFWRQWQALSPAEGFPALAGMGVVIFFALIGLSECWVARSPLVIMYVMCLSVFWSSCRQPYSEHRAVI